MPDWNRIVRKRLAALHLRGAEEADLAEEVAQHLEDRYRELTSAGESEEEAYRKTAAELDDLYPLRAAIQPNQRMPRHEPVPEGARFSGHLVSDLWKDLCFAGRTMRKNPLFVLFVVLTLGLGIGANTAVFTLINTLILNPLPVSNPSQLAAVSMRETVNRSKAKTPLPLSYPDLQDYRAANGVFRSLAGYTSAKVITLKTGRTSQRIFAELVTANYFQTLGLRPARGRFFLPREDSAPGDHPVAVLNYGTWQTRFGGAHDIVGKSLRLDNVVFTVVGVAPPHFIGVNAIFGPDLWIPAAMAERLLPVQMKNILTARGKGVFQGVARLKPGIGRKQAQADLTTIASTLAREYPETDQGHAIAVEPIFDAVFGSSTGSSSPIVFGSAVLLIVVALVLLIACSNVANLLLARSVARRHEMAVRLAMGASRVRLIRQLLTESVLLALLGGVAGLAIAYGGLRLLWSSLPNSANFNQPKLDATVFVFALAVSLLTGLVFGALPAWRASRTSLAETLKQEAHTVGRVRNRIVLANAVLAGQVALSFLLLVTAALVLRSIGRAYDIDPGFQTKHLAVIMTNPGQAGYSEPRTKAFYKKVRERVAAMPGIASVSWASDLPLWARPATGLRIEGRVRRSQSDILASIVNIVDTGYFETAGVPIDRGRAFTNADRDNTTPVAIVNEKLAHDQWPAGKALGKRIQIPGETVMRQIVGIARTANYSSLAEPPQPCVYMPLKQHYSDAMTLYLRTKGDPRQMLLPVQRQIRAVGREIWVNDMRTGPQIIDNGLFQAKMAVALLTVFGLLALGLASIGLYGILAYSVNQRTREIGLRMALGATPRAVVRLVLKQGMSLVAIGVLIGFAVALAVGHLLSRMLYGISSSDPVSIAAAAFVLLAVAFIACYVPARRASNIDPLIALREG
ncbi:MAG: ADOP family duplicated permease [Bryobacteraceae bacterium]